MYESEARLELTLFWLKPSFFEKSGCCESIENVFGLWTSSFTVKSTNGRFGPIFGDKIGMDHGVTSGLVWSFLPCYNSWIQSTEILMITNQPKSSQIVKWTQDKAKSVYFIDIVFSLLSRLTNFFSIFCFPYKSIQIERIWIFGSCLPVVSHVPLSFLFTSICSVHSGAFVAYSGVTLVSLLFVAVSFQLVPLYSGTILVHSVSFHHVPVYSVLFQSVPLFSNAPKRYGHLQKYLFRLRSPLLVS